MGAIEVHEDHALVALDHAVLQSGGDAEFVILHAED